MVKGVMIDRCPTGIAGFDELCQGGLVRNSVNVLLGGPGSGKTIFLMQFLYNGVTKYNENGVYLSFEPDVIELFKDAAALGWDMEKLDAKGQCRFVRISPDSDVNEIKRDLTAAMAKYDIRRICLDPVSLFASTEANESKIRKMLYDLSSTLKRLGATVLMSDETATTDTEEVGIAGTTAKSQYIKFLVDGVIDLYSSGLGGVSDRAVRISKMRRTNHSRGPIPMSITDDGITIVKGKKGVL
ncbi:AAA family ATPase [Candidatus Pacearchaeota archaeon]|nr:AAA family ATPase [Candidatus Pacearchaeota archaeon]